MTQRKRRNQSPVFKAKGAWAAVRGERILVDLADQFEGHPNQIQDWKKKLVAEAEHVFGAGAIEAAHSERETQAGFKRSSQHVLMGVRVAVR